MTCRFSVTVRRLLAVLLAAMLGLAPPVAFAARDLVSAHGAATTDDRHDHDNTRDLHKHSHSHDRSAPDHSHESGGTVTATPSASPEAPKGWHIARPDHVPGRTSHPPERPPRLIVRT